MNKIEAEELMERTRTLTKIAELEFFEVECKQCIGTLRQKQRKCRKLEGWDYLSCNKKNLFLTERTDIKNKKNFSFFFKSLQENLWDKPELKRIWDCPE